jgi:thioredoxin reductase (NADPH)
VCSSDLKAQGALAARVLSDKRIATRFSTRVAEIRGEERVSSLVLEDALTRERRVVEANAVFVLAGLVPESALVGPGTALALELDAGGFIVTDEKLECSTPGVFAAGDVRSTSFRQVVIACGEGALAAHSAGDYVRALAV